MRQNRYRILKILLPLIFTGYIGVLSSYTHIHVVNGVTIVHSHPFKDKTGGKPFHSHSRPEFQLINSVTSYSVTADVVSCYHLEASCVQIRGIFVMSGKTVHLPAVTGALSLRAPPSVA